MQRFGLRAKFIVLIVSLLVIIFALITFALVRLNTGTLRSNLLNDSKSFASLATEPIGKTFLTYKDSGHIRIGENIQRFTDLDSNVTNVIIVDTSGKVQFAQRETGIKSIPATQAASFKPVYIYDDHRDLKQVIVPFFEDFGSHRFSMVYEISSAEVQASIQQFVLSILFFVLIALIFSIGITYFLINQLFILPIRRVSRQAMAISAGQLDQQIELDRDDEISDLARSVNTMADSLKDDIAKLTETDKLKTEFMIIASHNLRTPLSVINGYLEQADDLNSVDGLKEVINVIATRSKQLGVFAEDVLTISSIEAGRSLLGFQATGLEDFLKNIAEEFVPSAKQKDVNFNSSINVGHSQAKISAAHLRSSIWNLLDNALKFTKQGGNIEFTARIEGDEVVVVIKDTGIGISSQEIPKLFTKFHRGTDIMQYDYEGTGIGLYATKLVVEQHGGSVDVESVLDQGSSFTVRLPLVKGIVEPPNKDEA
jgi:signal transduction histidine kinase